jgi:transposase
MLLPTQATVSRRHIPNYAIPSLGCISGLDKTNRCDVSNDRVKKIHAHSAIDRRKLISFGKAALADPACRLRSSWPAAVETIKRSDAHRFVVLPRRWVIERTIAWLNRCRRLAKDWEATIASSEAWLLIASSGG